MHLQAQPEPRTTTDAEGRFSLDVAPSGVVVVTAALAYDPAPPLQFTTGGVLARDGADDILIELEPISEDDNDNYVPIAAEPPNACGDCHAQQLEQWRGTAHAGAAVNPWVLDLYSGTGTPGGAAGYVFRDLHDPEDTGFCATCHTPVAEARAPGTLYLDEVEGDSALEGVNCSACHTIDDVNDNVTALHLLGNATMRFPLAGLAGSGTHEHVWGPLDDVDYAFMRAAYQPLFSESRFCASCHEYENPTTGAPGQTTYSEWLASRFAQPGPGYRSCQSCHMPKSRTAGTIADPPPLFQGIEVIRSAEQRHSHAIVGTSEEFLVSAVLLELEAEREGAYVDVETRVSNIGAGHAFPTGVSLRNAILVVDARVAESEAALVSGPVVPEWGSDGIPGEQEGDLAGKPGRGYAKVLEGRINGTGEVVSPVLFIDAERLRSDTAIPAGGSDTASFRFAVPPGAPAGAPMVVTARLLYRRALRAIAVTKGWTTTVAGGPIEVEVARETREVPIALPVCVGDCDANAEVTVDEIVTGVAIALGTRELADCERFDASGDGEVTVDELLTAINAALTGCGI